MLDAVGHPGTLNAGPPVQPRAYAAAASSTEWPAPLQAMRGHSDRQQLDSAAADSSGPLGAPQSEAPVRVIPRAGAGPGCEATRPWTARAAGTKRLWQVGVQVLQGQGARATSGLCRRAVPSRSPSVQAGPRGQDPPPSSTNSSERSHPAEVGRLQIGARYKPR
jgi:hypothetical protein